MQAKVDRLQYQLEEERKKLKTFNEEGLRIARLQREFELHETDYRKYTESLEQTKIEQALPLERISNISVAQPATYDPQPVRSRRLLLLVTGLVIALFGSFGLALVLERLDCSVKESNSHGQKMGLPERAAIPHPSSEALTSPAMKGRP